MIDGVLEHSQLPAAFEGVLRLKSRHPKPLGEPPHEGCTFWINRYSDGEYWKSCRCGAGFNWPFDPGYDRA